MVSCFVFGCNHNSKREKCNFYRFPPQKRARWAQLSRYYRHRCNMVMSKIMDSIHWIGNSTQGEFTDAGETPQCPHVFIKIKYNYTSHITRTDLSPIPVRSAVKSNCTSWCNQNLSKRALNWLTLLTSTTSFGRLFQILTMRAEKQYFRALAVAISNVNTRNFYQPTCAMTQFTGTASVICLNEVL